MPESKDRAPQRLRSPKVELTKPFLDELHSRWHEVKNGEHPRTNGEKRTLEQWGQELAKLARRPKPFNKGQLSKFLRGENTQQQILEAMCLYFQIPTPVLRPHSIAECEWFSAGQALLRESPEDFKKMLRIAKSQVGAKKELRQIDQGVASNPEPTTDGA